MKFNLQTHINTYLDCYCVSYPFKDRQVLGVVVEHPLDFFADVVDSLKKISDIRAFTKIMRNCSVDSYNGKEHVFFTDIPYEEYDYHNVWIWDLVDTYDSPTQVHSFIKNYAEAKALFEKAKAQNKTCVWYGLPWGALEIEELECNQKVV